MLKNNKLYIIIIIFYFTLFFAVSLCFNLEDNKWLNTLSACMSVHKDVHLTNFLTNVCHKRELQSVSVFQRSSM